MIFAIIYAIGILTLACPIAFGVWGDEIEETKTTNYSHNLVWHCKKG
jgi:hypothetical protein